MGHAGGRVYSRQRKSSRFSFLFQRPFSLTILPSLAFSLTHTSQYTICDKKMQLWLSRQIHELMILSKDATGLLLVAVPPSLPYLKQSTHAGHKHLTYHLILTHQAANYC